MLDPLDTTIGVVKPLVKPLREAVASESTSAQGTGDTEAAQQIQGTGFFKTPSTPIRTTPTKHTPSPAPTDNADPSLSAVTLDGLPLPLFVNTVYATILKRNVSLDPAVQSRTDLVSLRTGKPQTPAQLASVAQAVLRSYGVTVNEFDGLVRVVPANGLGGASPEIIRGRAQPDVPSTIRPIYYFVELENTSQANVTNWIRTMFQGRVTVTEDAQRNAIMLSGQSDSVMAAVETIATLDQPILRGRHSARITPVFWSATELASKLVDVLGAQGYQAGLVPTSPAPVLILPIAPVNSLVVFAVSEDVLNHTLRWARELDQTPPQKGGGRYITYYVRNTDAAAVAKTLQDVLGVGGGTAAAAPPGTPGSQAVQRATGSSRVVVNAAANSIIIQSSSTEYQQIYGLLLELDRPARSALIMATVAEVSLTDDEQFGFNWLLTQFSSGGYKINGGMGPAPTGGVSSASGLALNIATLAGDPRALLTALATSSRVRVLSNPSIVAINGQTASIQVGEDVPLLTSQISNSNTGTGTGQGILQTVEYRNVGIILKVKPVIHSGGRIDLEISQEVSGVSTAATGLGNSPVVNTRRVDTRLSVVDGNTMLIGGLIREQRDGGNAGIPFLKDVPLVGGLFRTSANNKITRTELVLLITPHILEDDFDSRAMTEAFRSQFSWGVDLPVSVKSQPANANSSVIGSQSVASRPAAAAPSPVYEVPEAPALPTMATLPVRPSVQKEAQNATTPASTIPAATSEGTVLTDEKLKQELLETIRNVK